MGISRTFCQLNRLSTSITLLLMFILILILKLHYFHEFHEVNNLKYYYYQTKTQIGRSFLEKTVPPMQQFKNRIVIGIVSCDKVGSSTTSNLAAVLIKSVLISASLHNVSAVIFHVFLESLERQTFFQSKIQEYGCLNTSLQVEMHFHSVLQTIPVKYHKVMIYTKDWRCSFVRLFLSSSLPNEDAIIYLDTDNIVTGNINNVWNLIGQMNERQLIGVAPATEPWDKNFDHIFKFHFADIPHVPPKGLNSGVLLMNLTKMRKYGWTERMLEVYNNYSKTVDLHADQRILNILLHFERYLLMQIPCQFNYEHIHCDNEQICKYAELDPNGIEILHGAGGQFVLQHSSLYEVFRMYQTFNNSYQEARVQLMMPVRKYFEQSNKTSQCFGNLNSLLFKNIFYSE